MFARTIQRHLHAETVSGGCKLNRFRRPNALTTYGHLALYRCHRRPKPSRSSRNFTAIYPLQTPNRSFAGCL
jgi:hypothetical protein